MIFLRCCAASLVLSFGSSAFAQPLLSIKAGYAASSWWGGNAVTTNLGDTSFTLDLYGKRRMHSGICLGVAVEQGLFSSLSFQPELLFSMKGYGIRQLRNDPLDSIGSTVTMNYLEIPLLIKWRFDESALLPSVYAGPSFGVLVGSYGSMEKSQTGL